MAIDPLQIDTKADTASDTNVGRLVVELKLATIDELQECQAEQQRLRAEGKPTKLADVLIEEGYVTKSQLRRLLNPSEDTMTRPVQQLPGFQIMQKIGAGAMATVYKAKQLSLDRIVAIKVLPKRLSENPEFVTRFYKEGRAAAALNHNNIVQAIDVGESAGYHYFVMEFVDGITVYDELVKKRVYEEKRALDVVSQIARALRHAHARGFIHRDVKPKNIMITKDGVAKLADMGLAREAGDAVTAAAEAGRAYGTPYYISPEQIRGQVNIDFRTDIYSLGATFYHMVTGKVPFDGATPSAVMHKHLKEPLTPPDHLNSKLSTGVAEVIERMMAKEPKARYQSSSDLLQDLERIQGGEAPMLARKGYGEGLLKNLADGAHHEEDPLTVTPYPAHAQIMPMASKSAQLFPVLSILMAAIILVQLVVIIVLAAV